MLFNILQCTNSTHKKNYPAPNVSSGKVEKPCYTLSCLVLTEAPQGYYPLLPDKEVFRSSVSFSKKLRLISFCPSFTLWWEENLHSRLRKAMVFFLLPPAWSRALLTASQEQLGRTEHDLWQCCSNCRFPSISGLYMKLVVVWDQQNNNYHNNNKN